MASAGDIREIMEIPNECPPRPAPKKVRVDPGPRLTGFQREVQSLMSDSHNVPPIPIVDNSRYKAKPTYAPRAFKTRKWEERCFVNGARTDGLVLRHWKHSMPASVGRRFPEKSTDGTNMMPPVGNGQTAAQLSGSVSASDENTVKDQTTPAIRYDDEFPMEKFNVKPSVPSYTPEQYEAHFKSEDWSKEETDYLMGLCRDFDLRWIVVADRYDPAEIPVSAEKAAETKSKDSSNAKIKGEVSGEAMTIDQSLLPAAVSSSDNNASSNTNSLRRAYPSRTMESLKARYYAIASKMLSITTPPDTMTPSEFALWEKMKNFDARTEELRKNLAEKLFMRTKEEADEERVLLEELARITRNEEEFLKMRKDLYQRLETPVLSRRAEDQGTAAAYHSSSGLGHLLSNLLNREKRFKRPGMIDTSRANLGQDANGEAERGTAGTATDRPRKQTWEKGQHPNQYTARRNTMDAESANGDGPKKTGSLAQTPNVRPLTTAEEAKYGVAHPQERITSGVQFRHEKASKIVLSKSAAQMAKIQAALVELGIPVRLLMPTEKVCREYERLVADIVLLLDARRGVERVNNEVRVLEESRRMRLGLSTEGKEGAEGRRMGVNQEGNAQNGAKGPQNAAEGHGHTGTNLPGDTGFDHVNVDVPMEDDGDEAANHAEANAVHEKSTIDTEPQETEDGEDESSEDAEPEADQNASESEAEGEDTEADVNAEVDAEGADAAVDDGEDELAASPEAQNRNEDDEAEEEEAPSSSEPESDNDDDGRDDGVEEDEEATTTATATAAAVAEEEADDSENQDGDAAAAATTTGEGEDKEVDDEQEEERREERPRPPSVPARLHKRSASVISEGSRAGSNRSGVGRKKGRR